MRAITQKEKDAIAEKWLTLVVQSFPSQSQHFLQIEKDPFRNPMGHTVRENLPLLLDEILGGMDHARLTKALDAIMHIRAVQDCAPSGAIEFLFQVPPLLRELNKDRHEDWEEAVRRTQEVALMAFDLYMTCREKIYALRTDEARRRMAQLERIYQETDVGLR